MLHLWRAIAKIRLYLEVVLSDHNQLALRRRVWNVYDRYRLAYNNNSSAMNMYNVVERV